MTKLNRDFLFAAMRVATLLGAVVWLHMGVPSTQVQMNMSAIYWLLGIFALYSTMLYALVLARPSLAPRLYRIFLLPDVIFLALLVRFTGSGMNQFEDAFYLLVALHTYYYQSMRAGLLAVLTSVLAYVAINHGLLTTENTNDLLLRLGFLLLVALSTGFLTLDLREAHARLNESVNREKIINQRLDGKLAQITSLYQVNQELARIDSTAEVYALAVESATSLLQVPFAYLMYPDGNRLILAEGRGLDWTGLTEREIRTDVGVLGKVFRSREPLVVADIKEYQSTGSDDFHGLTTIRSIAIAPICAEKRIFGLMIAGKPQPNTLSQVDLRLLSMLANMTGTALGRIERYESTKRLAFMDVKTHVYNYRYFKLIIDEYVNKRAYERLSLMMLDIDHFKNVNDTYGHQIGDEVLKQVAAVFSGALRSKDMVARFGGEEFVAILPDCPENVAAQVGERIRSQLAESPVMTSVGPVSVTVSLGIAALVEGDSPEGLINRADRAMYKAKESGRNKVCTA